MNIEIWAYIRHLFFVEKLPKKAIARKLSLDPKTVRRALKKQTFSNGRCKPRSSKLDDFKDKINELVKNYLAMSAVRTYEEIQKLGYSGGISILRDYLKTIRTTAKVFFNIQTTPAEQAQVDWAMGEQSVKEHPPSECIAFSWCCLLAACSIWNFSPLNVWNIF